MICLIDVVDTETYLITADSTHNLRKRRINALNIEGEILPKEHKSTINSLVTTTFKDVQFLLSGGEKIICFMYWNADWSLRQSIKAHSKYINDLKILENENMLLSCSDDCTIII